MCTKGAWDLFCLDLELFANQNAWFLHTCFSHLFINDSSSKQNQKNPEHAFTIFAKSQQKILKFVVVGARQSFKFFRKLAWLL